jgi:hypothetical protein
MADEINPGFVACDDCNRVLAVDDGPTCPECKSEARARPPGRPPASPRTRTTKAKPHEPMPFREQSD